jgi:SAM-dependent methyltransferase
MTVLEPGPGVGFFTLEIAKLVGPFGRVVAVDVQPRMIKGLKNRARKAGLLDRIDARVVSSWSRELADLDAVVDFVFAFAVVHELPSTASFFSEATRAMKSGADLLLAEPAGHVSEAEFAEQIKAAADNGLRVVDQPLIHRCIAALLRKS